MAGHSNKDKRRLGRLAVVIAAVSASGYFGHHAVYGRYGLNTHSRLTVELEQLSARRAALQARRNRLSTDIKHLRHPPHPDLIEEAARSILGYEKADRLRLMDSGQ